VIIAQAAIVEPLRVTACEPELTTVVAPPAFVGPYYPYYPYYPVYPYYYAYPMWAAGPWYGFGYSTAPTAFNNGSLTLHYTNQTDKVMKIIDFGLIANGRLVAQVRDVGKFSPGIEIKHRFDLDSNVFPIQTALPLCTPLDITFEDGATWTNPGLERMRRQNDEPGFIPESEPSPGNPGS
jgi:hypothetical protein